MLAARKQTRSCVEAIAIWLSLQQMDRSVEALGCWWSRWSWRHSPGRSRPRCSTGCRPHPTGGWSDSENCRIKQKATETSAQSEQYNYKTCLVALTTVYNSTVWCSIQVYLQVSKLVFVIEASGWRNKFWHKNIRWFLSCYICTSEFSEDSQTPWVYSSKHNITDIWVLFKTVCERFWTVWSENGPVGPGGGPEQTHSSKPSLSNKEGTASSPWIYCHLVVTLGACRGLNVNTNFIFIISSYSYRW